MFRTRGENLRSVHILLFLNVAFFFLEYQDAEKYVKLFSFDRASVIAGEVWRLFTYQFTQGGQGWFSFPRPVVLFFTLLLLYLMGTALEEEWGTRHFLSLFAISTIASAAAAAYLGIPLMVLDAWEHAWYLQYENRKTDFFEAAWNLWNWQDITKRYDEAKGLTLKLVGAAA